MEKENLQGNLNNNSYGSVEIKNLNEGIRGGGGVGNNGNFNSQNQNQTFQIQNETHQNQHQHQCTMLEAASNQIAVVTGAGMLSLPYAAASMG